ncbi:hypothetical protein MSAN_01533300 [Mycena sanguinolenta]|uniref:F-box domain-containing protein n=1 Tax=Mycena sanguinolenta TaxID=230812 RepID=A0A8H7CZA3_9AGAR|nr:hypothetical protein MSAN_01533300 [Mycena sanguinolenta]
MSSPTTLFLADLAPDIIFSVFALCDICSVVAAGQTCRSMHDLAFDRSVWRNLLRNLQRRSILDCTLAVNLETLSTDQMISIVRQLITGPQIWSPPGPDGAAVAEVSRKITLHLPTRTGPQRSQKKAKLLPSGLYVLVDNSGTVECWNVANNKLVWRHISAEGLEFAAEEDIELAIVVIILVFSRTGSDDNRRKGANFRSCVEIVSLDLQTGNHTCLLTVRAVDYNLNKPFAAPVICGTLAAVCINSGANAWMIINWKAQSYFIVQSPSPTLRVALVPRHIILMDHSVDRKTQVHLISNDTLRAYWAPTIDVAGPGKLSSVLAEAIPKLSTFQETSHQHSTGRLHIYIYPSPLREGEYRVWIHGRFLPQTCLYSYRLSIPSNGEPQWHARTPFRAMSISSIIHSVSYSGHVLRYRTGERWSLLFSSDKSVVNFLDGADSVMLGTYSGTLTHSMPSSIVIQYFK